VENAGQHLILYDGVCGLCNRLNAFVLPRDPEGKFHYAPLQSAFGDSILRQFGRDASVLNTFYVVADYRSPSLRLLSKSQAALFVAKEIRGLWKVATILRVLPRRPLDVIYDLIARHRYRIFGRYDSCPIPTAEHKGRFIGLQ
jgi:predicted DCC family thiol-disulfide oxidoreductase YuxK